MACIFNHCCFNWRSYACYEALSKKDENFGIEQTKEWVQKYPIDEIGKSVKHISLEKINTYTNKVIKDLQKIPITSVNIEMIKDHLVKMAEESDLVGQALWEKVSKLNAQEDLIRYLRDELNL